MRLWHEVISGNISGQALSVLLTDGTACCSDFRSRFARLIIEDFCAWLRKVQVRNWHIEALNRQSELVLCYFGVTIIAEALKDVISLIGLSGGEMERNTFLGLLFRLSCYGPAARKHFQLKVLPRLTEPNSPAWETALKEIRLYSEHFHTRMRAIFAIFLNSPNSQLRSSVLSWIAGGINRNNVRTKLYYQQLNLLPPMEGLADPRDTPATPEEAEVYDDDDEDDQFPEAVDDEENNGEQPEELSATLQDQTVATSEATGETGSTTVGPPQLIARLHFGAMSESEVSDIKEFLTNLTSPSLLVSMVRLLVEMIVSILRSENKPQAFDIASALLMPNMLDLSQDIRWGVQRSKLREIQLERRKNFEKSSKEARDAATRGLLLLYTIKYFEIGYLPELEKLKEIRKILADNPHDLNLRGQVFLREAHLLDELFINEALEVWVFVAQLFAYDVKNRPQEAQVYPEAFITTMLVFFTEIGSMLPQHHFFKHHRAELTSLCSNLLDLVVTQTPAMSIRLRASIVRLLHNWIQSRSPAWLPNKTHIYDDLSLSDKLYTHLLKFGIQFAEAIAPTEADPSMENIQLRSLLTFMWDRPNFQQKRLECLGDQPKSDILFSAWCTEILSYTGAAFECIKTIRDHENNATVLSDTRFSQYKTRAKIFLIDFRNLMLLFTSTSKANPELFTPVIDEIVQLIYFALDYLVGTNCEQLVIQCSREVHFSPKTLVSLIGQLCLHLQSPRFCVALGSEESHSKKTLVRLENILRLYCSAPATTLATFHSLVQQVTAISEKFKQSEPPAEFLDALVDTIMRDPVMLPASQKIVDRQTIVRILKTNPIDPYTRTPLSINDLQPQPELKSRLDQFWAALGCE